MRYDDREPDYGRSGLVDVRRNGETLCVDMVDGQVDAVFLQGVDITGQLNDAIFDEIQETINRMVRDGNY